LTLAKVKIKKAIKNKKKSKSKNHHGIDSRTFYNPESFQLEKIKQAAINA